MVEGRHNTLYFKIHARKLLIISQIEIIVACFIRQIVHRLFLEFYGGKILYLILFSSICITKNTELPKRPRNIEKDI